jgi:hypothetical protein
MVETYKVCLMVFYERDETKNISGCGSPIGIAMNAKMIFTAILLTLAGNPALAETDYIGQRQVNPRNDPDVERGYRENQYYDSSPTNPAERIEQGPPGVTLVNPCDLPPPERPPYCDAQE